MPVETAQVWYFPETNMLVIFRVNLNVVEYENFTFFNVLSKTKLKKAGVYLGKL